MDKWDFYNKTGIGAGGWTDYQLLEKYASGRVLDTGCGRGILLAKIKGAKEKFGIDISEQAIEQAKKICPEGVFLVGDARAMKFPDNYFDFVYSIDAIEHLEFPERFLAEAKRVLKPDGIGFIQTPNYPIKRLYDFIAWLRGERQTLKDDYTHISKFRSFELKKLILEQFEIIEFRTRNLLGENKISFLKKIKKSFLGIMFGQKTIAVFKKS